MLQNLRILLQNSLQKRYNVTKSAKIPHDNATFNHSKEVIKNKRIYWINLLKRNKSNNLILNLLINY